MISKAPTVGLHTLVMLMLLAEGDYVGASETLGTIQSQFGGSNDEKVRNAVVAAVKRYVGQQHNSTTTTQQRNNATTRLFSNPLSSLRGRILLLSIVC